MNITIVDCIISAREGEEPFKYSNDASITTIEAVTFKGYRILPLEEFARLERCKERLTEIIRDMMEQHPSSTDADIAERRLRDALEEK